MPKKINMCWGWERKPLMRKYQLLWVHPYCWFHLLLAAVVQNFFFFEIAVVQNFCRAWNTSTHQHAWVTEKSLPCQSAGVLMLNSFASSDETIWVFTCDENKENSPGACGSVLWSLDPAKWFDGWRWPWKRIGVAIFDKSVWPTKVVRESD
jgi:hypothetical protein